MTVPIRVRIASPEDHELEERLVASERERAELGREVLRLQREVVVLQDRLMRAERSWWWRWLPI